MNKQNIIIFSSDFPPLDGGVANYAFEVANSLHHEQHLQAVITYSANTKSIDYPITRSVIADIERKLGKRIGDRFSIIRKINTWLHYREITKRAVAEWIQFQNDKVKVVAVSCYGYKQALHIEALIKLKINYILVLHGLDIVTNQVQIPELFSRICNNAERIILNSNATKNLFLSHFPSLNSNCSIQYPIINRKNIENVVSLCRAELATICKINLDNKIICFTVARLIKRKGIDIAIRVVSKLHKKHPNICFFIAGKGPEFTVLQNLIEENNASDYIKLIGFISDEEKFSLLRESSFFLMPTNSQGNTDFEGFGISFIEASYFETVVFGGIHGGVTEAICHRISGYTFDFDLPVGEIQLYETMLELIDNQQMCIEKARAGKKFVSDNFFEIKTDLFLV